MNSKDRHQDDPYCTDFDASGAIWKPWISAFLWHQAHQNPRGIALIGRSILILCRICWNFISVSNSHHLCSYGFFERIIPIKLWEKIFPWRSRRCIRTVQTLNPPTGDRTLSPRPHVGGNGMGRSCIGSRLPRNPKKKQENQKSRNPEIQNVNIWKIQKAPKNPVVLTSESHL